MVWRRGERAARAEYERFFHLSVDLLCIAGFDGYFKLLNPAWEKVLGYSPEELMARPYLDFVHPDDREATLAEAAKIAGGTETLSFDNRYSTRDGEYRWLHWSAAPRLEEERIYAVARDVTERRRAQEALAEAKAAAEEADQAKSRFLATMSHELRTPLNAVIGFSDVLLGDTGQLPIESRRQYLARIRSNGTRLLGLIDRILDLEKIASGHVELELEDVGVESLLEELVEEFEPQAADNRVRLRKEIPDDLLALRTDYERLRGVVANLLSNAVKFAPGGEVVVRVTTEPESRRPAAIEIEDTGIGIPEDKLEQIFERFKQLDTGATRRYEGSGLGLAISKVQCNLLGFDLSLSSEVGSGSTFRITLDSATESTVEAGERDSQAIALRIAGELEAERCHGPFGHAVVLVIDANSDSRIVLTETLRTLGCQVLAAGSAGQGLELARAHSPGAIVIDLHSIATPGDRLVDPFAGDRRLEHTPILAIASGVDATERSIRGVAELLRKPLDRASLERALARNLTPPVGRVLVVESSEADRERLRRCLAPMAAEWRAAASGRQALIELAGYTPDLAVIELGRERVGEVLIEEMRRRPHLRQVPIVLIAAEDLRTGELERIGRDSAPVVRKGDRFEANLREVCWQLHRRSFVSRR